MAINYKRFSKCLFIVFILLFISLSSIAQTRIRVYGGGSVPFIFNSLTKYDNGIVLNDWTRLQVQYQDNDTGHTEWELRVRASHNEIQYDGPGIGNNLPLETLEIFDIAVPVWLGSDGPAVINNSFVLSENEDWLIRGTTTDPSVEPSEAEVVINYRIGVKSGFTITELNSPSGYYFVDLFFRLHNQE